MAEAIKDFLLTAWFYADWAVALLLLGICIRFLHEMWLFHRQSHYKANTKRQLYEIKIPRELTKGPAAMDQFFAALFAFGNWPGSPGEKYWDGEDTRECTFELVGINGEIHLFMHLPIIYADAIIASFYAQYPEVEIVKVDDYLDNLPRSYDQIRDMGYELWGMELYLANSSIYPIKTYAEFEQTGRKSDDRDVDPVAFFIEFVNNMPRDEVIMVQFICSTAFPTWQDEGKKEMRRLYDELKVFEQGVYKGRQDRDTEYEKSTSKSIDKKTAKDGFHVLTRMIHIAPKETFNVFTGYRNFYAFFTQLTSDHQRFTKNTHNWTKVDWYNFPFIFPKRRLLQKQRDMYHEYLLRFIPEERWIGNLFRSNFWHLNFGHHSSILNTEELATLFHPPTNVVITTGLMDRVESRRVAPPSGLPS